MGWKICFRVDFNDAFIKKYLARVFFDIESGLKGGTFQILFYTLDRQIFSRNNLNLSKNSLIFRPVQTYRSIHWAME